MQGRRILEGVRNAQGDVSSCTSRSQSVISAVGCCVFTRKWGHEMNCSCQAGDLVLSVDKEHVQRWTVGFVTGSRRKTV